MALMRQKHPHPAGLVPPRTQYKRTLVTGFGGITKWVKEKEFEIEGDNGTIVDGRVYVYHPTRGWRSRAVELPQPDFDKLPPFMLAIAKAMFRKGIAI